MCGEPPFEHSQFTPLGGLLDAALGSTRLAADQEGMTSSASPNATWLPAAMLRAAVVHPTAAAPARGRHRAPAFGGETHAAMQDDLVRPGRHAEPEEEDSLAWLGFSFR